MSEEYSERQIELYCFWVSDNLHIFEKFKDFSIGLAEKGRSKYSAETVINYLRWHEHFESNNDQFKINNNYKAMMARHLVIDYPNMSGFFTFRKTGLKRKK